MSGIFSTIKLWDVVSDTWSGLRAAADGGSKRDIRLPKSSEADLNKVLAVTALDDDEIQLSYVSPSLLQGAQGIQGEQGVPGVNGVNGNGLTFVGSMPPEGAQNGDTWLFKALNGDASFRFLAQRVFDKWISLQRYNNPFNAANISSNTTIRVPMPVNSGFPAASSLLAEFMMRLHCYTNLNANNRWTISVGTAYYAAGGAVSFFEVSRVEFNEMTQPLGEFFNEPFFADILQVPVTNSGWVEIRITKTGTPGPLHIVGNVASYEVYM